ncbi:undecaprenyldiphospho-muramoylpentapeptide beta-N-acetylglucosaminyltransferase [Glaciecola sp. MH2013]|uniref:undecaprenyldiphospho-muramoylpentapeptide beta-N-acetylglucosaminyltransferase n=1 Tax=Glaciecola sp. MH2013 TaxID=2785524 RepID=UPI00189CE226|nr:undecaprenyldiphospho-muramoylpentapeptide beta-N-acetylglucosaminyltransferase [Glaciecola sp. MH2013]MBF7072044.1 undecaprenyldiphospho-muramoylpentapeptide beta-N-acetylglucosaminyltransferase [Glaciecola sp. MH2013]
MTKNNATNQTSPLLFIMAGGTGGHVFPGLAVAKQMLANGWRVEWFGTQDKIEAKLVPANNIVIHFLKVSGVRGKGLIRKLVAPFMLLSAVVHARKVLKERKPDAVLGMGGFASGPGGIAAWTLGIPVIVHEQNAIFGMTNRWLAKIATRVLCGFDVTHEALQQIAKAPSNVEFVGNPVRADFFNINKPTATDNGHPTFTILVVGGSLGALALNQKLPKVFVELASKYSLKVIHQAGKGKKSPVDKHYKELTASGVALSYEVVEFIDDMPMAFASADIIICRSGALTVAEVAASSSCAIFVPLPIAVDDHQTYNAKSLSDNQAGILISQSELASKLPTALTELLSKPQSIHALGTRARELCIEDATEKVALACIQAKQG